MQLRRALVNRVVRLGLAVLLAWSAGACSTSAPRAPQKARAHAFTIGATDFLLDGQPVVIRSGEMHAARVPHEYWRQRLKMVRALGCNTVCAYLFWNQHEPRPGEFDFEGQADVAQYCRIAQEEGLWVILRPGPYACAEWDLGGFPSWLLKERDIRLRTRDPRYLEPVRRYLKRVGQELAPLQVSRGGPILMVQVENEYGSYGDDKEYIGAVRDALVAAGFDVPLFTCDGPAQLPADTRDDIFSVVNFGGDPKPAFEALRKVRPSGPLMCGEFYPGWFDSWGKPHHTTAVDDVLADLRSMLEERQSFSIYMVHGGTSFGFSAGANSPPFAPQTTSYDYDAPIDEAGRATPKFHALRALFAQHLNPGETLPAVPAPATIQAVPRFALDEGALLFADLGTPHSSDDVQPMEDFDQAQGCILYRTTLPAGPPAALRITDAHDIAYVYVDGQLVDVLDRRGGRASTRLGARERDARLELFVEAMGRVNYGGQLHDRKGITQKVELIDGERTRALGPWQVFTFPFDRAQLSRLRFARAPVPLGAPAVYRGHFEVARAADTFLDLGAWSKGAVWVNGHALGRYWNIGPQQTLYLPGCWLRKGVNEVLVLDVDGRTQSLALQGLEVPILDQLGDDSLRLKTVRRAGQELDLSSLQPIATGRFADDASEQRVPIPHAKGRYLTLVSLSSHPGDPFTTCAEIGLDDVNGTALPRSSWSVIWADSEEIDAENGSALNVLDGSNDTLWHTQWSAAKPAHPHSIVIDLGQELEVGALRWLPRQGNRNGRTAEYALYLTSTRPPGL